MELHYPIRIAFPSFQNMFQLLLCLNDKLIWIEAFNKEIVTKGKSIEIVSVFICIFYF